MTKGDKVFVIKNASADGFEWTTAEWTGRLNPAFWMPTFIDSGISDVVVYEDFTLGVVRAELIVPYTEENRALLTKAWQASQTFRECYSKLVP